MPVSVAVAEPDGDAVPELVTGNLASDNVSVLLPEPGLVAQVLAGIAVLGWLHRIRRRSILQKI